MFVQLSQYGGKLFHEIGNSPQVLLAGAAHAGCTLGKEKSALIHRAELCYLLFHS